MATVNLVPNADVTNSPAWTLSTGSDIWALLDEDFTGVGASDGSMISATATGKKCVVQFGAFDDTDVDDITSVQAILRTVNPQRGSNYTIGMTITNNGSGAASWAEQTIAETGSRYYDTLSFTVRLYSSAHVSEPAWETTDLDNIAMEIHLDAIDSGTTQVTYAYFIVTYTITAAAITDNATFFGANF